MTQSRICILLFALIALLSFHSNAQELTDAKAEEIFDYFLHSFNFKSESDLEQLTTLERHFKKSNQDCRLVRVYAWKGIRFDELGQLDSALINLQEGMRLYQPGCDSLALMNLNIARTSVNLSLQELDKVIEIADWSIEHWNPDWPKTVAKSSLYTNKAIAQVLVGEYENGLATFKTLLKDAKAVGNSNEEMNAYNNIAALYGTMWSRGFADSGLDSAEVYMLKAVELGKRKGESAELAIHYMNIGRLEVDRKNYAKALVYLDSADVYSKENKQLSNQVKIAKAKSDVFFGEGNYLQSITELKSHLELKDSLLDIEKQRSISEMQEKYDSEKKERQIKELEVDNLNAELREQELTRTRNIYLFVGIGILLISAVLWYRLRYTRKTNAIIQKEKDISENLLLNILPEEVAKELKAKGEAEAQLIDHVTVLFTDFKGFTAMSEILSPKELVNDLNECFSAFDKITSKYGIEKIKTIGDAYMAAGGLPIPNTTHALDVVKAAFEMRDFIEEGKLRKIKAQLPYFEIRIGVHTGPVVAGIVGVKKFQYDIWGDTVNTASRMESSGAVGQVNISQSTYDLLKDNPDLVFESRGKIQAKGKGEMEMYFVSEKAD